MSCAVYSSSLKKYYLKFGIRVGIGERISGKEFGENRKVKIATRGSFSMKK
jgi:hypothetical protein